MATRVICSLHIEPNSNVEKCLLPDGKYTETDRDTVSYLMSIHFPVSFVSAGETIEVGPRKKLLELTGN